MVDPRIYRACLALVAVAVIVFAFSFQSAPGGHRTTLASGKFFGGAYATMTQLADSYPARDPGSSDDQALAGNVRARLRGIGGFRLRTDRYIAHTATGSRELENVVATRTGLNTGTVVVVSERDATGRPATAELSGTAVMLGLARAFSGETLSSSLMLVSTSGSVGAVGAERLAKSLTGGDVNAVIVLGDLAGQAVRNPIVIPWSSGDRLAPPQLRTTLGIYLSQAGLHVSATAIGGQLAQLAFPLAPTAQTPFNDRGIPAVTVSLDGEHTPAGGAALGTPQRLARIGNALVQSINALSRSTPIPPPRAYLQVSGKVVPAWAVRLLVLALILPVGAATLDALARARRRRHSVARWIGWVLAGTVPFVLGVVLLVIVGRGHILSASPSGAVAGGVHATGGDVITLLVVAGLVMAAFFTLRPLCLRLLARLGAAERRPEGAPADAAGVALSLVMVVLTLIVWLLNPFAALLLVPALHLWLWLAQPGVRAHRVAVVPLTLIAVVPALLVVYYYTQALGLSLGALIWSVVLMVAGGGMSIVAALYWSIALGCFASALVLGLRAVRGGNQMSEPAVTVRGPSTYAGPGSLGGTKSALRR